ncbi:MAG: CpaF family protein [Anaerolineales bacterium]|jgi:pilus assembly protein CpaF
MSLVNRRSAAPEMIPVVDALHRKLSAELERVMIVDGTTELPGEESLMRRMRILIQEEGLILNESQIEDIEQTVLDRIAGMDVLEPYLRDDEITEIMVNDPQHVFIERRGRIEEADVEFRDEDHLRHIIERIVAPLGRRIDESCPMVDARLPDGSRVNAIIPPLAIGGPALTIRKFSREPFTLKRLIALGTLSREMGDYLTAAVRTRRSMIVSGGTGTGKTSTLNALCRLIPEHERLITIEDSAELQLQHLDLVALEARQPNIEGIGEIPIRQLVRNALRMRPDRIIVGEVRGGEAFDMLQAMNTGHRGSLTTLHANSPEDALIRLESMVLMAGFDLPLAAIRRMIASAIEVIIQQDRLLDGRRVVTEISEISGSVDNGLQLSPRYQAQDPTG